MTLEPDLVAANQLKMILDSSSVNFFVLDRDYRYTSFNRRHAETIRSIWGIDIALGMDMLHDVIHEVQDRAKAKSNFDRALAGEDFVLMEAYGDLERTRRFYDDHYSPARNLEQEIVGVIVFVTDVTERVRLGEDRLALEKKLQEAGMLESLGLLAGGVAHDINNLLVPIILSAHLVTNEIGREHPAAERLVTITESAKQAAELTKQLLAFSSEGWVVPELIDLNAQVAQSIDLAKVYIVPGTELVNQQFPDPLPVYADPTQIRQVVTNLLINAVEATAGRPSIIKMKTDLMHVDALLEADACVPDEVPLGDYAVLSIEDNGQGIGATQLEHIFELFYSSKGTGRGFGLAAAQGIIRKHSGFIAVDSSEGEGTTFRVGFPYVNASTDLGIIPTAAVPQEETWREGAPREETLKSTIPLRILIADGDQRILASLTALCERSGHQVTTIDRGVRVLQALGIAAFDVLILDVTLPDISGEDVVAAIPASNPVPVVLMSGFRNVDQVLAKQPRVHGLLSKPFTAEEFLQLLKRFPRLS